MYAASIDSIVLGRVSAPKGLPGEVLIDAISKESKGVL
jgi:hypothetical protein